jgi:hypothetical protein
MAAEVCGHYDFSFPSSFVEPAGGRFGKQAGFNLVIAKPARTLVVAIRFLRREGQIPTPVTSVTGSE